MIDFTYNDLILLLLIVFNILNIIFFCKKNILPTIITIVLIICFFKLYDFKISKVNKKIFLLITIMMSLCGPIMESIIIHYSNGNSWNYTHPFLNWYVPLWLLPGYGMLAMSAIHTYCNVQF